VVAGISTPAKSTFHRDKSGRKEGERGLSHLKKEYSPHAFKAGDPDDCYGRGIITSDQEKGES